MKIEDDARSPLNLALDGALNFLENLDQRSIQSSVELATVRSTIKAVLNDESIPAEIIIRDLIRDTDKAILGSSSGRFFGWAIGGTLPVSIAADWLVSVWD